MRRVAFAIPGDLQTATGGYGYDRQIIAALIALGWDVEVVSLGDGFPWPDEPTLAKAHRLLAALDPRTPIVIDGLAFGVMPEAAAQLAQHYQLIALVHHPLALENGLTPDARQLLQVSETRALAHAQHVIVTSRATARLLSDFEVQDDRISVVYPGTQASSRAHGSDGNIVELLSVGTITPRKGFDILVDALAQLPDLNWHLTVVGDCERDAVCAATLVEQIDRWQLRNRITLTGTLSSNEVANYYRRSDVFVLASHFEGYGMAYAEAMAHGLPIIGTTGGAIADTVPPQAGLLVTPGDIFGLAQAIAMMVGDSALRSRYADGSWAVGQTLPNWQTSGTAFANILTGLNLRTVR